MAKKMEIDLKDEIENAIKPIPMDNVNDCDAAGDGAKTADGELLKGTEKMADAGNENNLEKCVEEVSSMIVENADNSQGEVKSKTNKKIIDEIVEETVKPNLSEERKSIEKTQQYNGTVDGDILIDEGNVEMLGAGKITCDNTNNTVNKVEVGRNVETKSNANNTHASISCIIDAVEGQVQIATIQLYELPKIVELCEGNGTEKDANVAKFEPIKGGESSSGMQAIICIDLCGVDDDVVEYNTDPEEAQKSLKNFEENHINIVEGLERGENSNNCGENKAAEVPKAAAVNGELHLGNERNKMAEELQPFYNEAQGTAKCGELKVESGELAIVLEHSYAVKSSAANVKENGAENLVKETKNNAAAGEKSNVETADDDTYLEINIDSTDMKVIDECFNNDSTEKSTVEKTVEVMKKNVARIGDNQKHQSPMNRGELHTNEATVPKVETILNDIVLAPPQNLLRSIFSPLSEPEPEPAVKLCADLALSKLMSNRIQSPKMVGVKKFTNLKEYLTKLPLRKIITNYNGSRGKFDNNKNFKAVCSKFGIYKSPNRAKRCSNLFEVDESNRADVAKYAGSIAESMKYSMRKLMDGPAMDRIIQAPYNRRPEPKVLNTNKIANLKAAYAKAVGNGNYLAPPTAQTPESNKPIAKPRNPQTEANQTLNQQQAMKKALPKPGPPQKSHNLSSHEYEQPSTSARLRAALQSSIQADRSAGSSTAANADNGMPRSQPYVPLYRPGAVLDPPYYKRIPQPYCPFTGRPRRSDVPAPYNEFGCLRWNGADICDCANFRCPGCWYPCCECGSPRCGFSCRCSREVIPDAIKEQLFKKRK